MKIIWRNIFQDKAERVRQAYYKKTLAPMSETKPEDIFIAGYPKSGNTWFQDLAAGVVFGLLADNSHPKLVNDLIPDISMNPIYRRYKTPTYFKTHDKPLPQFRNVVYLLRDGRDAMVSYWHHNNALAGKEVDFFQMVREGKGLFPCKWHEHVTTWMANPYNARMITIKYEDLINQPVRELARFCTFSGIEVDTPYLELIVEKASFKKLQNREKRLGESNDAWPRDKAFFRRGVAGSFRDEMPEEVLAAFLSEARETLEKQGYSV